jgi:hypothetical protein
MTAPSPASRRTIFLVLGLIVAAVILLRWHRPALKTPIGARPAIASPARLAALQGGFQSLEALERGAARDRWDPDYLVGILGKDPNRLFAWVRDSTSWIPYHGVLRGAVGVLMDRQGNSLDRAILLATLMERAGQSVRLAHGTLDARATYRLLPALVARRAATRAAGQGRRGVAISLARSPYRFVSNDGDSVLRQSEVALGRIRSELDRRVVDQTTRLLGSIRSTSPDSEWHHRLRRAAQALSDHWWVETQEGEQWRGWDLLANNPDPGRALTARTDTLRLADLARSSLNQEIVIRLIGEQWAPGSLTERRVLEHTLRPADVIGQSIVLQLWPMDWVPDSTPQPAPQGRLGYAMAQQRAWAATLLVGQQPVVSTAFFYDGENLDSGPKGGAMGALARGLKGALEGSPGKQLTAMWLEYEIRIPEEDPRRARRAVFDLIGPAARAAENVAPFKLDSVKRLERALALTMRTEILPIASDVAPSFIRHLATEGLLANRAAILAAAKGPIASWSPEADSLLDGGAPMISPLYALATARSQWTHDGGDVFIDQPEILTRHLYPSMTKSGIEARSTIDIVSNDVGVSLANPDAIRARVAQGVFDTNAESLLRLSASVESNVGDAFASSKDWIATASVADSGLDRLALQGDLRRRVQDQLAGGFAVVAPTASRDPFPGWWRINPGTGHTLGFGDHGWGEGAEYNVNATRGRLASPFFKQMMKRFGIGFFPTLVFCLPFQMGAEMDRLQWRVSSETVAAAAFATMGTCVTYGIHAGLILASLFAFDAVEMALCPVGDGAPPTASYSTPEPVNPLGETQPGPVDPLAETGLNKTRDLGKTSPNAKCAPAAEPEGPPENAPPLTKAQAAQALQDAVAEYAQANSKASKASQEFVRYQQNSPESNYPHKDPSAWDPDVAEALDSEAQLTDQARARAMKDVRKAIAEAKQAGAPVSDQLQEIFR